MMKKISLFLALCLLMTNINFMPTIAMAIENESIDYCMDLDFTKYADGTSMSTVMEDYPNVFPAIEEDNSYKGKLKFAINDGGLEVYSMQAAANGEVLDHFPLSVSHLDLNSGAYYVELELTASSKKYTQLIIESTADVSKKDMTCSDFYAGNQMKVKLEGSNVATSYADDGSVMKFVKDQTVGLRYLVNLDERQIDSLWMKSDDISDYRLASVNGGTSFAYRRSVVTEAEETPGIGKIKFGAATGGACAADELLYTIEHIRIWKMEEEPTATPTIEPTATPTVEPTATPTVEPTATPTAEPTATPTVGATSTPTVEPTATPTVEPTATPTVEPTATPTAEPTATPTAMPIVTEAPIKVDNYCIDLDFTKYADGTPMSTVMEDYPNVFPAIEEDNTYKGMFKFAIEGGKLGVYSMQAAPSGEVLNHFPLSVAHLGLNSGAYYVELELAASSKKYTQLIIESTIESSKKDMTCSDFYAGNKMRVKLEGSNVDTAYADNGEAMYFEKDRTVGLRYLINVDDRQIDGLWMKGDEESGYRLASVNSGTSFAYRRQQVTDAAETPGIGGIKFGAATSGSCEANELLYTVKHIRIWETDKSILTRAAANLNISETDTVTEDITLPSELEDFPGVSISWESDNEAIISKDGKVILPEEDTEVTLNAKLHKNDESLTKTITLLVKGKNSPEATDAPEATDRPDDADNEYCIDVDFTKYADGTPMSEIMADYPNVFPAIDENNTYKAKLKFAVKDGLLGVYSMVPAATGATLDHFPISVSHLGLNSGAYYVEIEMAAASKKYTQLIIESTINSSNKDMTCSDVYAGNQMRVKLEGSNVATKYADDDSTMKFEENQVVGLRYLINLDDRQIDGLWMKKDEASSYRLASVNGGTSFAYRRQVVTDSTETPGIGRVKFGAATGGSCEADELIYTIKHIRIWESEKSILTRAASKLSAANLNISESGVVTGDVTLPSKLEGFSDVDIIWESNNEAIISNAGRVVLPEENTEVTLTAKLQKNGVELVKPITLLVRGKAAEEHILFYETFPDAASLQNWQVMSLGGTIKANGGLTITKNADTELSPTLTRNFANDLFKLNTEITTEVVWTASTQNNDAFATVQSYDGEIAAKAQFLTKDTEYGLSYIYAPNKDAARPGEEAAYNVIGEEGLQITSKWKVDAVNSTTDYWFNGEKNPSQTVYTIEKVNDIGAVTLGFDQSKTDGGVLNVTSVKVSIPSEKRLEINEAQLTFDKLSEQSADAVTYLELPTEGIAGVKIEWTSSNDNAVNSEGKVFRTDKEQAVTLTAKLYKEENPSESVTKSFEMVIKPLDKSNLAYQKPVTSTVSASADNTCDNLTDGTYATSFTSTGTERKGDITVDLGEVKSISEVSLYENKVDDSYKIKAYSIQVSKDGKEWTKVATLDEMGEKKTISFDPQRARYVRLSINSKTSGSFSISELEVRGDLTDEEIVDADTQGLSDIIATWNYIVSDDLELPTSGVFGSTISWSSNNEDVIDDDGNLGAKPKKDTVVVMTAEIKYGEATEKTTYRCMVKGKSSSSSGGGGGGGSSSGGGGSSSKGGSYFPIQNSVSTPVTVPETGNEPSANAFNDLDTAPWAVEAVNALYSRGVINGDGNGNFYPARNVTREEFTKMLVLWLGLDIPENPTLPFSDCSEEGWYYGYLAAAFENDLIKGFDEQTFGIGQSITRQDMAVILYRAVLKYNIPLETLSDVTLFTDTDKISDYAVESVTQLHSSGVLNGDGGLFRPTDNATRSEVAALLYRLAK